MGSHVVRGYTGPPMPADLCSSGCDRETSHAIEKRDV
jgi:hypothetical protein